MTTQSPALQNNSMLAKKEKTNSERFTDMVINEFTGTKGELALTAFQKRLVQNYFISVDNAIKIAEERRLKKDERFRDKLPVEWKNINLELLAVNVVACARIGFDPACANHINMVPYKNNMLNKYDMVFIEGYRGKELKARKYGFDIPSDVVIELVYSTDTFVPIKKDRDNKIETYEFKVNKSFDRGEIVGGFYYFAYTENPEKNKLMFYSKAQIEKRKPEKASPEFWGGEKDVWEYDQKSNKKVKTGTEHIEGWYEEMMWKTLCRIAYGNITIDSQKIDDDFIKLSLNEKLAGDLVPDGNYKTPPEANNSTLDIDSEVIDPEPETTKMESKPVTVQTTEPPVPENLNVPGMEKKNPTQPQIDF